WVPIALVVATIAAMRFYLASPKRRAPLLVALLLVDLFFVTGFVDVPADGKTAPDPEVSPAASWLRKNAPQDEPFFVWGLGKDYFHRAPELLLPKTGQSLGFATLASYGAWQSPTHVHVFGFNNCGVNRNWRRLLRRNYLLSLYGVRYILAAEPEHRKVIESVRVGDVRAEEGAPSLLGDQWTLTRAEWSGGAVMRLRAPLLLLWSTATQPVKIAPATIYRMALDARAPEGEAANFLRAEIFERLDDDGYRQADEMALTVDAARIGSNWRHFEWTFRSPEKLAGTIIFRVFTMSERTIEVRGIRLRKGHWPMPVNLGGRLKGGQAVYKKVAELPPLDASSPPVAVYENRLCLPARSRSRPRPAVEEEIEELKWSSASSAGKVAGPPQLAVDISSNPQRPLLLLTVPAVIAYVAIAVVWLLRRRGR
ncbi:MAG: hypothetical protein KAU28_11000, partial [Phycisphaerae bacterium]|nr:hypothetical protein [Phycisphaerae bacterium]